MVIRIIWNGEKAKGSIVLYLARSRIFIYNIFIAKAYLLYAKNKEDLDKMKAYLAPGSRKLTVIDNLPQDDSFIKVKISSILPINDDVAVYEGKLNVKYPVVPCGLATAIISEDNEQYKLKRGQRVIINPYITKYETSEDFLDFPRYGFEENGFLCDFTAVPYENLILFPDGVKDDEAIFTYIIALALTVLSNMTIEEGSYIALVGDSILNLILAQLLRYYKTIPIFVSRDERYIKLAKKVGCYFVVNEIKENVIERIYEITGGRLAKHTIFNLNTGISTNFLHLITSYGGDCIIANASYRTLAKVNLDIGGILNKKLVIKGISDGIDEFPSAINLLAQKELSLTDIIDTKIAFSDVQVLFSTLSKSPSAYVCPIIKV